MRYVLVLFAAVLLSACSSMGHWRDSSGGSSSGSRDSSSGASSRNSSMGMGMGMMRGNDGAGSAGYNYSTMPLRPGDTYYGS
jgi:hypothetical protein